MTTTDLINTLRDIAADRNDYTAVLMNRAADRLEELDERVAIMMENEPGGDTSFEVQDP